jgi:hypothetical protein
MNDRELLELAAKAADIKAGEGLDPLPLPVAWRYWKDKFACWEYSDVPLEFPAVPAGTKMEPLYAAPQPLSGLEAERSMKWTIEYDNDTGPGDEGFWEWWTVSDVARSFKCDSEEDAKWLCELLNPDAGQA